MATMKDKAIARSDELWPDYGDPVSHAMSGGFIDGAVWADLAPAGDLEAELRRRFSVKDDEIEELVNGRWRSGFRQGVEWVRSSKPSVSTPREEQKQLYIGLIFDPSSAEGIEADAVIHTDLEELRATLKLAVDETNRGGEVEDLSWQEEGFSYWPDSAASYGDFAWAKIQEVSPGVSFRVSEFA